MTRNERGALQIPLLLALALVVTSGLLLWGMFRHWRFLVETQLRMDRCTGEVALVLKSTLEAVESGNRRLEALRITFAAASAIPGAQAPVAAAMTAETLKQDASLLRWKALSAAWVGRLRCGDSRDAPEPLPALHWLRPPPDPLGPRPLVWTEGIVPGEFILRLAHAPRISWARIQREKGMTEGWNANWVFPRDRF